MDSLLLVQSKQAPINTDECVVTFAEGAAALGYDGSH